MIHRFKNLLKRFHRDESGAFLVLFGVLAIVLVATSGAVVDFSAIEQARTRAQVALDAAALGLQPHVFDTSPVRTEQYFIDQATPLLRERMGLAASGDRITATVTSATISVRDGMLRLEAEIVVPTYFVALVGVQSVRAHMMSEATRKRLNLEVVMVLDNSGSMTFPIEASKPWGDNRMKVLKEAATSATDILFDNAATQPNVFVGVVPFTGWVNVGTANRTATWMSQTGASSISHLNFDNDDRDTTAYTGTVNRWSLYDGANSESWSGCVEARVTPYDTNDTLPNNAVPDTMFQPAFAPDGPADDYTDDQNSCTRRPVVWTETKAKTACTNYNSNYSDTTNYNNCTRSVATTRKQTDVNGATVTASATQPANNVLATYYNDATCVDTTTRVNTTGPTRYNYSLIKTCTYNFSVTELQQRLCKYAGASFDGDGPNVDCGASAILPLTNQRATVNTHIDNMVADGSTNIEQGTVWGFYALSPSEPLTQGRDYLEATSKVLIVMTDGTNNVNYEKYTDTEYGVSSWMAWGYRSNKRLLTESTTPKDSTATETQVIAEVNRRTLLACTNAKAEKIIVYTIGLDAANNATTKTMLQSCATPTTTLNGVTTVYSFFPTTAESLKTTFKTIAAQLSELRLAK